MNKNWKNKTVLITAGSTWVLIDSVRVITNIFSGSLGYEIAQEAARRGAHVVLLLGNGMGVINSNFTNLKIIRYKYFNEFSEIFKKYVPIEFASMLADLLIGTNVKFKVVRGRKTKLGDFRYGSDLPKPIITVNGDLNPYAFLITALHEFAHYHTYLLNCSGTRKLSRSRSGIWSTKRKYYFLSRNARRCHFGKKCFVATFMVG